MPIIHILNKGGYYCEGMKKCGGMSFKSKKAVKYDNRCQDCLSFERENKLFIDDRRGQCSLTKTNWKAPKKVLMEVLVDG